jgi:hypothetical protein
LIIRHCERGVISLAVVLCICTCAVARTKPSNEPNGILKLEGKHIKLLALQGSHAATFRDPNSELRLPVGEYRINDFRLDGDYTCQTYYLPRDALNFTITEGQTTTLKVGAPLTQSITAARKGNRLALSYKLTGIGGEPYTESGERHAPTFAVYSGDNKVGSGTFAYG